MACLLFALAPRVWARSAGIDVDSCSGCHRGGKDATITVTADPAAVDPGGSTTLTVRVSRTNGSGAGFHMDCADVGKFDIIDSGTKLFSTTTVSHNRLRTVATGDVTFQVKWTAPTGMKGGVDFDVAGISANSNGSSSGDGEGTTRFSLAFGCPGIDLYTDSDGDGFGWTEGKTRGCEVGPHLATKGGDCNDSNEKTFPGAIEICNGIDDNCNGQIDEGLSPIPYYRDNDGDGYGAINGDTKMGCGNISGYAPNNSDCDDNDPRVHPNATEICNLVDDNCDGRTDENVRPTCGVGWCRRAANTCEARTCTPGKPTPEVCNGLDDDCDGEVDNAATCPDGKTCALGECLTAAQIKDAGAVSKPLDGGATTMDGPVAPGTRLDAKLADSDGKSDSKMTNQGIDGGVEAEPVTPRKGGGGCQLGQSSAGTAWLGLATLLFLLERRRRR